MLDQVGEHLGVGLRLELVAVGAQPLLDLEVVLDDPVVDDDERALAVGVGVGVLLGRTAMGRPARMADAERTGQRPFAEDPLEHLEPAGGAPHVERAVAEDGDARGVVAAILEPLEPLDDDTDRALPTDVPDDSTHG